MTAILPITLPVYLAILAGLVATRLGYLGQGEIRALSSFVIRVPLPCLIFLSLSRSNAAETLVPGFFAAYALGSLAVFWVLFALACRRRAGVPRAAMDALGGACSNTGFLGFPIATMAVGIETAAPAFAMISLIEAVLIIGAALALADAGSGGAAGIGTALRRSLVRMVTNPLLIAVAAGLAASLTGLTPPGPVMSVIGLFAPVAAPVALFALGGIIVGMALRGAPSLALRGAPVVVGKLVAHPLLVLALLVVLPGVPRDLAAAGVLMAAMPMLTIYPLLSQRYGAEAPAAANMVAAVALSFFTVSGVLAAILHMG